MNIYYIEIVSLDVNSSCDLYAQIHDVQFMDPDGNLGGARVATMSDGRKLGIRAPMHDGERPVTRVYMLVDDIERAVAAATKAGAQIAVPPMQIPGHGTCAIYIHGGIETGLWQL